MNTTAGCGNGKHTIECCVNVGECGIRLCSTTRTPETSDTIESGWLIEEAVGGEVLHWIALAKNQWPRTEMRDRRLGAGGRTFESYLSPIERVKDTNEALRFARREDAEAFIELFDRFLLLPKATEHEWHGPKSEASDTLEMAALPQWERLPASVQRSLCNYYWGDHSSASDLYVSWRNALTTAEALDARFVLGPVVESEEHDEDDNPLWTAEVQTIGGDGSKATIFAGTETEARADALAAITAWNGPDTLEMVVEALKGLRDYGCPVCSGDCAGANPHVVSCPMQSVSAALAKAGAA